MANPHKGEARSDFHAKMKRMTGKGGTFPPDRAERIAHQGAGQKAKGDSTKTVDAGIKIGAPARQVTNREVE